jgi:hypothetical protein
VLYCFVSNCSALFRLSEDDNPYVTFKAQVKKQCTGVESRSYRLHPIAFSYFNAFDKHCYFI